MSVQQSLELTDTIKSNIDHISNSTIGLSNQVDVLLSILDRPDVLKSITNDELQKCVDVITKAGLIVNKVYEVKIVPYPKPIEFKKYCANSKTDIFPVYQKIIKMCTQDLIKFAALYMFDEVLWYEPYHRESVSDAINYLLSLVDLDKKELITLQQALDTHCMQVNILSS
jgi:Cu2+-containing amine oxidase